MIYYTKRLAKQFYYVILLKYISFYVMFYPAKSIFSIMHFIILYNLRVPSIIQRRLYPFLPVSDGKC